MRICDHFHVGRPGVGRPHHVDRHFVAGCVHHASQHYALRAGWRYDYGTGLHTPSLGFGYVDPRWSVEAAVRHDLVGDHAATMAVLSLRYFYDAAGTTTPADSPDAM